MKFVGRRTRYGHGPWSSGNWTCFSQLTASGLRANTYSSPEPSRVTGITALPAHLDVDHTGVRLFQRLREIEARAVARYPMRRDDALEPAGPRRPESPHGGHTLRDRLSVHSHRLLDLRQAEIQELYAALGHQNVRGFEIPVGNPFAMCRVSGRCGPDPTGVGQVEIPSLHLSPCLVGFPLGLK
jgi:hypothetical protein